MTKAKDKDLKNLEIMADNLNQKIDIKKNREKIERVIIVGGGFAGIRAALNLLKEVKNIHITLIDKNSYHQYHPDYYEVVSATTPELKEASISQIAFIRQTVAIPYEKIFTRQLADKKIEIARDEVSEIDFKNEIVLTLHKQKIPYDWLIISAGSETSFYNIPGLSEIAYEFKNVCDALNIRNAINEACATKPKKENINIIIGGGGLTGCEVAAELAGYVNYTSALHGRPRENIKIKIIEASQEILGGASPWARRKTKERLHCLMVEFLENAQIEKVERKNFDDGRLGANSSGPAGKIFFKNKKNREENFDILIWTAGVEASRVSKLFPKDSIINPKLCLNTDENLFVLPFKNVFATGDIGYCFNKSAGNPLPMTAQTAISQGEYAARAIQRKIKNRILFPYNPKQSKFIIPLGGKYALADLRFIKFSGFFAWALKHIVTLDYFLSILPLMDALKLWLSGLKIYIKNDKWLKNTRC